MIPKELPLCSRQVFNIHLRLLMSLCCYNTSNLTALTMTATAHLFRQKWA